MENGQAFDRHQLELVLAARFELCAINGLYGARRDERTTVRCRRRNPGRLATNTGLLVTGTKEGRKVPVLDPYFAAKVSPAATRNDASIPRRSRTETRIASAWTVTVQVSVFLALLVLPVILIRGWWAAPATTALIAGLTVATRQSRCHYQRLRLG